MTNLIIVESRNDQYFIEALARRVSKENKVISIHQYSYCSADRKSLIEAISPRLADAEKEGTSKIGIILDQDTSTKIDRMNMINDALKDSFDICEFLPPLNLLSDTSQFVKNLIGEQQDYEISISCFFTNIDGKGELETVLKAIKTQDSPYADCLEGGWLECLKSKGKKLGKSGESCDITD
jgi:hypothetical protein